MHETHAHKEGVPISNNRTYTDMVMKVDGGEEKEGEVGKSSWDSEEEEKEDGNEDVITVVEQKIGGYDWTIFIFI